MWLEIPPETAARRLDASGHKGPLPRSGKWCWLMSSPPSGPSRSLPECLPCVMDGFAQSELRRRRKLQSLLWPVSEITHNYFHNTPAPPSDSGSWHLWVSLPETSSQKHLLCIRHYLRALDLMGFSGQEQQHTVLSSTVRNVNRFISWFV